MGAETRTESGWGRRAGWAALAVAAAFATAIGLLWGFMPGPIGSVDGVAKYWQASSMAQGHYELTYPAKSLDPTYEFIPDSYVTIVSGKPYSNYFGVFSYVAAGMMKMMGPKGFNMVAPIACLLVVGLTVLLARQGELISRRGMWALLLTLGLCTPLWAYAVFPLEHVLAAAFGAGAFVAASAGMKRMGEGAAGPGMGWCVLGGVLAGLAALTRGECYLFAAAMGVVALACVWRDGLRKVMLTGGALFTGGVAALAGWYALHPFWIQLQTGMWHGGLNTPEPMAGRLWRLALGAAPGHALETRLGGTLSTAAGMTTGAVLLAALCVGMFSRRGARGARMAGAALLVVGTALTLCCFTLHGMLVVCPMIVAAAFALEWKWLKENRTAMFVLGTSVVFYVLSGLLLPHGGAGQFGPRFLLPVAGPLAAVMFGRLYEEISARKEKWLIAMAALALVSGFVSEVKGIVQCRRGAALNEQMDRQMDKRSGPFVKVAPMPTIYHAPKMMEARPVLEARDESQLAKLTLIFREHGISSYTAVSDVLYLDDGRDMIVKAGGIAGEIQELPYGGEAITVEIPTIEGGRSKERR